MCYQQTLTITVSYFAQIPTRCHENLLITLRSMIPCELIAPSRPASRPDSPEAFPILREPRHMLSKRIGVWHCVPSLVLRGGTYDPRLRPAGNLFAIADGDRQEWNAGRHGFEQY